MRGRHPVQRPLDTTSFCRAVAASGMRVVRAAHFLDLAVSVRDDRLALDDERVPQPDLVAWVEPEELLRRILAEVILFDVEHARERYLAGAGAGVLGVVH